MVISGGNRPNFAIGGNYPQRKILKADDLWKLEKKHSFKSKIQENKDNQIESLYNNLV